MAYIGNEPVIGQWRKLDDISGSFNGSLTSFTTQVGGTNVTAGSANQLLVSLGGVLQEPGTDYSVSSSTITFTTAPAASLSFFAVLAGDALNTSVPADGSITTAKLGANLTVDLGLGSAGTPSLTFDADTGLFSGGDNQVNVSTSGVERAGFGASEVVFNDGGADYDFRIEGDTNANLFFVDASTDRVGLGTNSPSNLLHIAGTGTDLTGLRIVNTQHQAAATSTAGLKFGITNSAGQRNCRIQAREQAVDSNAIALDFFTNSADAVDGETVKMTILNSGNVGIGTTSPDEILTLREDNAGGEGASIRLHNSSATVGSNNKLIFTSSTTATFQSAAIIATRTASGTTIAFESDGTNERLRIDESGRLLVGTATVSSAGDAAAARLRVSNNTNNTAGAGILSIERGEAASAMADGDLIGRIVFSGTTGGDFAYIEGRVDGTPSGSVFPGALRFSTTKAGESTPTEWMRITQTGRFHFSSNAADSPRYGNTNNNSISSSTGGQWAFVVENNNDTDPFGMLIDYDDASPDNTTNEFLRCTDSTATRLEIRSDGDVWTSDSGVLTSDATLKRDITDATPKLDDLMRLRVRNFYWIPEYHPNKQDKKLIGFIAQEVEEVFPGLVSNDNHISGGEPIFDEEGNDTGEKTPEVLKKGLKEAKLVPILVKALQEAVERIETLEAKVAALEAQ